MHQERLENVPVNIHSYKASYLSLAANLRKVTFYTCMRKGYTSISCSLFYKIAPGCI